MPGIGTAIGEGLGLGKEIVKNITHRSELRNREDIRRAKIAEEEAKLIDEYRKLIKNQDLESIRKILS